MLGSDSEPHTHYSFVRTGGCTIQRMALLDVCHKRDDDDDGLHGYSKSGQAESWRTKDAYAETSSASLPLESRPTTVSQPPTCFWSIDGM